MSLIFLVQLLMKMLSAVFAVKPFEISVNQKKGKRLGTSATHTYANHLKDKQYQPIGP